jgi:hypothetical protein
VQAIPASGCFRPPHAKCRSCLAEQVRQWRAEHPEYVRRYNEARRIGPREAICEDCGSRFTAGKRGPMRTRCDGCYEPWRRSAVTWSCGGEQRRNGLLM